jgi:hypothetical protein
MLTIKRNELGKNVLLLVNHRFDAYSSASFESVPTGLDFVAAEEV